jgi:TatD DNase family protein
MFNLHSHIASQRSIINIDSFETQQLVSDYYYSLGNHPWYKAHSIEFIKETILSNLNIIAIGECGFDKLKSHYPLEKQIEILKEQIDLSEELKIPLILHIVKGYNEIIQLKKLIKPTQKWIIHGFNNYKQAKELIKLGFCLSFGEALLKSPTLQKSFLTTPITNIFLETDSSDVTIENLYTLAASLRKIDVAKLKVQIRENIKTITNGKLA